MKITLESINFIYKGYQQNLAFMVLPALIQSYTRQKFKVAGTNWKPDIAVINQTFILQVKVSEKYFKMILMMFDYFNYYYCS